MVEKADHGMICMEGSVQAVASRRSVLQLLHKAGRQNQSMPYMKPKPSPRGTAGMGDDMMGGPSTIKWP